VNDTLYVSSSTDTTDIAARDDAYVEWGDQFVAVQVKQFQSLSAPQAFNSYGSNWLTNVASSNLPLTTITNQTNWSSRMSSNIIPSSQWSSNLALASHALTATWSLSTQLPWGPTLLAGAPTIAAKSSRAERSRTNLLPTYFNLVRPTQRSTRRVREMQKWEGRVLEVDDKIFTAELDPCDHNGIPVIADFDLYLLSEQIGEVQVGDLFYLTVRTVLDRGRPVRTSILRPRLLGKWTADELKKIDSRTERLTRFLDDYAE
jgi:hypothetical protein